MPWDALVKILEASNKFLFAGAVVGFAYWYWGPADPTGTWGYNAASGLFGLFCTATLLWEAVAKLLAVLTAIRATAADVKEAARRQMLETAATQERQKRALTWIRDLDEPTARLLGALICRDDADFHAPYMHPAIRELREKALIEAIDGQYDLAHYPFRVADFVLAKFQPNRDEWRRKNPNWQREITEMQAWQNDWY